MKLKKKLNFHEKKRLHSARKPVMLFTITPEVYAELKKENEK